MEAFNEPAIGIEGDNLVGLSEAGNGQRGEQQPVNRLFTGRWLRLNNLDDLHGQAVMAGGGSAGTAHS